MIYSFPKIWNMGNKNVATIFNSEVEITEKVDGSQFNFGIINGELFMRSKGADIVIDHPHNMFILAVDYVLSIKDRLEPDHVYHCEFLNKPKHNVIQYDRVPINNLVCFGVSKPDGTFLETRALVMAHNIGIESVPTLFYGRVSSMERIEKLLETESYLGGHKIAGVVIKNYIQQLIIGDRHIPIVTAKYVSGEFKEKHNRIKKEFSGKGRMEILIRRYRTEARWHKAVQHLKERGELTDTPKDIGSLMREVHRDLQEECKEEIMEALWREYGKQIKRVATAGMSGWYKKLVAVEHFKEGE